MNNNAIVGLVVIIGIAGIAVAMSGVFNPVDLDAIIASKDCDKIMSLTDGDVNGATAEQQIKLGFLITGCTFSGP